MTCDHLVCANCAGRVSDGRCPVCRAHRARLQEEQQGMFAGLSPQRCSRCWRGCSRWW